MVGAAVFTTGPVALQLGLLAAALGRWDDAARHLGHAVTRCDRLGARLYGDRAERARVLADADGPDGGRGERRQRVPPRWRGLDLASPAACATAGRQGAAESGRLLAAPGQEVAAADLVTGGAQAGHAFGAAPVLDERARAEYRARLAELDDELAQADAHHDIERSAGLAAERDALIDELARATGLGGRRRRLGDAAERARTTVTAGSATPWAGSSGSSRSSADTCGPAS